MLPAALLLCGVSASLAEEDTFREEDIAAPYCIVVDAEDVDTVFFAREPDARCLPASTTKIMTCIVVLENCEDLSETVTVTRAAASMKETNSLMGVIADERLTIEQLLYGLMLESGNDAARLLAERFGGSVEGFADMMNEKAKEIGMSETTCFVNASGAYKAGGKIGSTVRDMAKLTAYALKNEKFRELVSTARYTIPESEERKKPLELINSNRLLSDAPDAKNSVYYADCIGVKTGSTEQGGKCLISAAERDGATVICVMFGLKEGGSRNKRMERVFVDSKKLLERALDSYEPFNPADFDLTEAAEEPFGSFGSTVRCAPDFSGLTFKLAKQKADALRLDPSRVGTVRRIDPIPDTVSVGDAIGTLVVEADGAELFAVPITVTEVNAVSTPGPTAVPTPAPTPYAPEPTQEPVQQVRISLPVLLIVALLAAAVLFALSMMGILRHRRRRRARR